MTTSLGAEIERHHETGLLADELIQRLQDTATLTPQNARASVQADYGTHEASGDDDLVVDGHTAANQARVAALRTHGQTTLRTVAHDGAQLVGGARHQRQRRVAATRLQPVRVERAQARLVRHALTRAQHTLEEAQVARAQSRVQRVSLRRRCRLSRQ